MAQYKNPVTITVSTGVAFTFQAGLIAGFPEARAFLETLIAREVSPPVASQYVKLAGRLRKQGRLNQPEQLVHNVERTAANAYHRWRRETYEGIVRDMIRGFANDDLRRGIGWLRRSSLVHPYEGKVIRVVAGVPQLQLDTETQQAVAVPATFADVPCTVWTLHVPRSAVPVHTDPCADCVVIELDGAKLELVAQAFERAWGHRDLTKLPPESPLFGEPPPISEDAAHVAAVKPGGKIVALLPAGALAGVLNNLGAVVSDRPEVFAARAAEGADVLIVGRDGLGDERFADAVESLRGIASEAAREKGGG